MFFTKTSFALVMVCGLALTACNTTEGQSSEGDGVSVVREKSLPKAVAIPTGLYEVKVECADSAKTETLKNMHWTLTVKDEGFFIESQQNLDPNCEGLCSVADAGSLSANELQVKFTKTQVFDLEKNVFNKLEEAVSKTYFLSNNDPQNGKLSLIDNSDTNVCQGKMILNLKKEVILPRRLKDPQEI